MHYPILFQQRISCTDCMHLSVYGKFKLTRCHIGDLGMRMIVQRTDGPFLKGILHTHNIITIS